MAGKAVAKADPKRKAAAVRKVQHKKAKATTKARGAADPLLNGAWAEWRSHVLAHGPTWLYVLIVMQHLLCCRVTEILRLRFKDIDWDSKQILVGALKKRGAVKKPICAQLLRFLEEWKRAYGITIQRTRHLGNRGVQTFADEWVWPEGASATFMFPAARSDSRFEYRNKACKSKSYPVVTIINNY